VKGDGILYVLVIGGEKNEKLYGKFYLGFVEPGLPLSFPWASTWQFRAFKK
jgi:hypothetical protein